MMAFGDLPAGALAVAGFIFVSLCGLGAVLFLLHKHFIADPIKKIILAMDRVGQGDFSDPPPVGGTSDIAWLSRSLTDMVRNLDVVSLSRDMSSKNTTQRETLLQSEKKYGQVLDAISEMVLVKKAGSKIVWANKAFLEFYGMTNEQLQGMIDSPVNRPDYTQQYVKDDAYVFETGKVLDIPDEPVTRHDGTVRFFYTVKSPIFDDHGRVIMSVGVSRDITEKKLLLDQIKNMQRDLGTDGT